MVCVAERRGAQTPLVEERVPPLLTVVQEALRRAQRLVEVGTEEGFLELVRHRRSFECGDSATGLSQLLLSKGRRLMPPALCL